MSRPLPKSYWVCLAIAAVVVVIFPQCRPLAEPPSVEHFGVAWREIDIRDVVDGFELMTPEKTYRAVDDPSRYLVRLTPIGTSGPDDHWLLECVRQNGRLVAHGQCVIVGKDGTELQRAYDHGEWID